MDTTSTAKVTPKEFEEYYKYSKRFDGILKKVKIIRAANGSCFAELKISEEHLNGFSTLHGGFVATLVDDFTSFGVFTHEDSFRMNSVSVDLQVSFMSTAGLNDVITIDCSTAKVGNTMAFLECKIKNKATGELIATGKQTKYIIYPRKH